MSSTRATWVLTALLVCLAASTAASAALVQCRSEAGASVCAFDSGRLRLELRAAAHRLAITRLTAPEGPNQVNAVPGGSLWLLKLTGPGGDKSLSEAEATTLTVAPEADRALFCWRIPLPGGVCQVTMAVRVAAGDPLSYWSLEVTTPDGYQLADVEFPRLTNLQ
ncbi:MAG: hypothetical protein WCP21_09910, partial [Armatimonadota bacterium]